MKFNDTLQPAIFLRRYKRFLVDVLLPGNRQVTVYCPNTGSMKGCLTERCDVLLSRSDNKKRKYQYTLELTKPGDCWVGVNTARTNQLVKEAIVNKRIPEFIGLDCIQQEVRVSSKSRLDFLLHKGTEQIFLEIKNCTLVEEGVAMFPDAVTVRGSKHLKELIRLKEGGAEAAVMFCVQRLDAKSFAPASHIDPIYGQNLKEASRAGVKVLAYKADVGPDEIKVKQQLPVSL